MITSLKLENFRGFTDLEITPLQRINLIAGANNTGKTGLLEALYLLFAQEHRQVTRLSKVFRCNVSPDSFSQDDFATFWQSLFHDRQVETAAKVVAKTKSDQSLKCQISYNKAEPNQLTVAHQRLDAPASLSPSSTNYYSSHPNHTFNIGPHLAEQGGNPNPLGCKLIVLSTQMEKPAHDADVFNQLTLLEGGEEKLISLLREVDPRLQKLRYAKAPGTTQPLVYAHFGLKNALCMTQTGQGFSKLFSLFCQMLASKARILLIDEIENGLYYGSLEQIWRGIAAVAASEDIQVFATTHSRECIVAAHEAFKTMPAYDFALHRLQLVKGRLEAITHDQEMLEVAINSGMEVR